MALRPRVTDRLSGAKQHYLRLDYQHACPVATDEVLYRHFRRLLAFRITWPPPLDESIEPSGIIRHNVRILLETHAVRHKMPDRVRFALYSPLLPPAHGGQPIILRRILEGIDPADYVLIGDERYQNVMAGVATETALEAPMTLVRHATKWALPDSRKRGLITFPYYATREIAAQARQIADVLRKTKPELMVACTGVMYGFAAACLASKVTRVPLVPYIFDDYAYQSPPQYRAAARFFERMCLSWSSGLIVTNEVAAAEYRRRYGVTPTVVHNAFQSPPLDELDRMASPFRGDTLNIVFAGSIYAAHFDAFRNLSRALGRLPTDRVSLHLFSPQSAADLPAQGIAGPAIVHHGLLKGAELLAAERKADVLFLPLAFRSPLSPLLKTAAPGKMAEYLALERPILVHAPHDSYVSKYFTEHDCGMVVSQDDDDALARALTRLVEDAPLRRRLGANAAMRYRADFRVEAARSNFLDTLQKTRERNVRSL